MMARSPLSPRELDVLRLAAQGLGNKFIAERLSISQQTVKNHVSTALRRLDATDRTHACSLLDDLYPGWRPPLGKPDDRDSLIFRARMLLDELELARSDQ